MQRKGQLELEPIVAVVGVAAITILVSFWVYGSVAEILPYDRVYNNETMCTTCYSNTTYTFDNTPILNDTTLICYNDSIDLMTNGVTDATCLGYNALTTSTINITNTSASCPIEDVVCSYTHNEANDNEDNYWNTATTNINASFSLASVIPIILAALVVIIFVLFMARSA